MIKLANALKILTDDAYYDIQISTLLHIHRKSTLWFPSLIHRNIRRMMHCPLKKLRFHSSNPFFSFLDNVVLAAQRSCHTEHFLGRGHAGQNLLNPVLLKRDHALRNGQIVNLIGIGSF